MSRQRRKDKDYESEDSICYLKAWSLKLQAFFSSLLKKRGEILNLPNPPFKTKPFKHQEEMLEFIKIYPRCFLLGEVGIGKSIPAIYSMIEKNEKGLIRQVLVITPASVMQTFADEIAKHTNYSYRILEGSLETRRICLREAKEFFLIINYDVLNKLQDELIRKSFSGVICDEISYAKSPGAKRSQALFNIVRNIPFRTALTGTLLANRVPDVYMPFKIIEPNIFGTSFWRFKERYCVMEERVLWRSHRSFFEIVGFKNLDDLHKKIFSISILKKKEQCLDLPPRIYEVRKVEFTPNLRTHYNSMKRELFLEFERGQVTASNALVKVLKLSEITSGFVFDNTGKIIELKENPKLKELLAFLDEVQEKTIIWCRFKYSMKKIYDALKDRAILFSGDIPERQKNWNIKKFNEDPKIQFFIGSCSLGYGINLPTATLTLFYESSYSLADRLQSEGRNYRPGQEKKVTYVDILMKNSIDEVVYKTVQEKKDLSEAVLEYVKTGGG